jgi:adenylate cyclase
MKKPIIRSVIVLILGITFVLSLGLSDLLLGFELSTYDTRVRLLANPSEATDDVVLILLDQQSLDWAADGLHIAWPWPRELYAVVTSFAHRAGVKSLVYDVLYPDPSIYGVFDDLAFAETMDLAGNVVLAGFGSFDRGGASQWNPLTNPIITQVDGLDAWFDQGFGTTKTFQTFLFPNADLLPSARAVGSVRFPEDPDGVYRRGTAFSIFDNRIVPGLALAAYTIGTGQEPSITYTPNQMIINHKAIPIDSEGRAVIRYRTEGTTHRAYNAAAIIESELLLLEGQEPLIDPQELAGKYVLFGFSAPGLLDLRPTPIGPVIPGVEVHAAFLDNLLTGEFIYQFNLWQILGYGILLVALAAFGATLISSSLMNLVFMILIGLSPVALGFGLYSAGLWAPMVMPTVSVLLTLMAAALLNYATEGKQKRYIKSAFRQYLSPAVIEQLIENPDKLKLGGERRELSIFFSDLQGFTTLSEGLSPEELTSLLNEYLTAMTDIILDEGGTIDKYEGDAIIAFWNAPLALEDHGKRAVRAALACQTELARLRPRFFDQTGKELFMRIGLNTGPAVVGNMGSNNRFDYTMLGDSVNLAARLEGINKQFGTYTMISKSTKEKMGDLFPCRELSRVAVVGKTEPVVVFEPMTVEEYKQKQPIIEQFDQARELFYQGAFSQAAMIFEQLSSEDPPAQKYLAKCQSLMKEFGPEAIGDSWKGVWVMTEK